MMMTAPQKTGILLAAFGTANLKGQQALQRFAEEVRTFYPHVPVRWAFTSPHMRLRLTKFGRKTDSIHKALTRMAYERYTHVALQTLHMIPGKEFQSLMEEVEAVRQNYPLSISVGAPLLTSTEDIVRAAEAIIHHLPPERQAGQAVICMGHGTWHKGGAGYAQLALELAKRDPGIFIGTLEGDKNIDALLPEVKSFGCAEAWLIPLLSIIGKHAEQDMAGPSSHSWKSRLEASGVNCIPVLSGTIEYEALRAIWMDHLSYALQSLCLL